MRRYSVECFHFIRSNFNIPLEYPNINSSIIDIDLADDIEFIKNNIIQEVKSGHKDQRIVYRKNHRWIFNAYPLELEHLNHESRFKKNKEFI